MSTKYKFPQDFLLGVGSSAYQVEGAWDEDGKGESVLDNYIRLHPNWTADSSTGNIACDSYHQYATDVQLAKNIGVDYYRFSISWARILPTGDPTNINQKGIDYYNKLIDELICNGVKPMVTIYHWDMPKKLQELGGWTNRIIIDYYEDFCRIVFKNFGDRVRWWVTLNEPQLDAVFGYGQGHPKMPVHPPGLHHTGVADYLALHHLLLSHARAYQLYATHFYPAQKGKLGIAVNLFGAKPASAKPEDVEAANRQMMFEAGIVIHPFFGPGGDYPPVVRERVDKNSKLEGRTRSRLPCFTDEEKKSLKGSLDFVGLNYYSTHLTKNGEIGENPSLARDTGSITAPDPKSKAPGVAWLAHEPSGLRLVLQWIKTQFGNPPVLITENGCDDRNGLDDTDRITYIKEHLKETLKAMKEDGCKVLGYVVWSLMDSFEWSTGYLPKFGLCHVDFSDPKRKRTPKLSAKFYGNFCKTRELED